MTADRLTEIKARDTHYAALNCRECGQVPVSEDEYNRQISNPAALWMCPECGRVADFDDSYFEDHHGLIGDDMRQPSDRLTEIKARVAQFATTGNYGGVYGTISDMEYLLAEIERQQWEVENDALRAALELIGDCDCDMERVSVRTCNPPCRTCIARAALEESK